MGDKKYILWFSRIKKLGSSKKLKLLKYFKTGEAIFNATEKDFKEYKYLTNLDIENILINRTEAKLNTYVEQLEKMKISYTTLNDWDYPSLLKTIKNPPLVLYYLGVLPSNKATLVSIIGTRRPTAYGKSVTTKLSEDLAKSGVTIVSGMARGIDTFANVGAMNGNGKTIAVLGCSVDICYPPENREIMKKIANNGCVISEFPPKTMPHPSYFPMRNRIISGMSSITLVIEATIRSGTLITVDYALEQGRDVMVVPGNITSKQSEGTNKLIKEGAIPVTSCEDIINLLQIDNSSINIDNSNQNNNIKNLTDDEKNIYKLISDDAINMEHIIKEANLPIDKLQFILSMLEVKGVIEKLPGQQFIRSLNGGNI